MKLDVFRLQPLPKKGLKWTTKPYGKPYETLYFDIETSHMEVKTHYIGQKVSLHPHQIIKHKKVICISYLWNHEDEHQVKHLHWDNKTQCDRAMLEKFNAIAAKAKRLCGHNGQNFDAKVLRWMFCLRQIEAPWCETTVFDTLTAARRSFRCESFRLDALGEIMGVGRKVHTDYSTWDNVEEGVPGALKKMCIYCDGDVLLLRRVHMRMQKYLRTTANERNAILDGWDEMPGYCKECNGRHIVKDGSSTRLKYPGVRFQKYLCRTCGTRTTPSLDALQDSDMTIEDLEELLNGNK